MATPIQTYYVPLRELDLFLEFDGINSGDVAGTPGNPDGFIRSLIAIAVAAPGTVIWYDHWEDGYDVDYTNLPVGSTTSVWGDGDLSNNGLVTGVSGLPGNDLFIGGESIILENSVNLNDLPTVLDFDGGDRIVVSFPVAVTRAAYPTANGSTSGTPAPCLPAAPRSSPPTASEPGSSRPSAKIRPPAQILSN